MNDNLFRELKAGNCALILGPEFHLEEPGEEDEPGLCDFLRKKLGILPFMSDDGFFFFKNGNFDQKKNIVYPIQKYFEDFQDKVPDNYVSLARLPFSLIISLSPDEFIRKAFDEIKKPYEYRFFAMGEYMLNKQVKKEIEFDPTSEKPLIFNLLGSYTKWESMVFTHDSLFEFLYHFFDLEKLSQKFKTAILNASSFLFLGFRYNRWYLRLIFFMLQKIREGKGLSNMAVYTDNHNFSRVKEFYTDGMQFNFDEGTVTEFIGKLYKEATERGLRYESPVPDPATDGEQEKFRIMYISASPMDRTGIPDTGEFRKLKDILMLSGNNDRFTFTAHFAASRENYLYAIEKEHPHFVIFSAHGTPDNHLLFMDESGMADPLSLEMLTADLQLLVTHPRSTLKYLLFSCCNSDTIAQSCAGLVKCEAIGMQGLIGVTASGEFNERFLQKFFSEPVFKRAFEFGKWGIMDARQDKYRDSPKYFDGTLVPATTV